tara:strand:- start:595 stop:1188 length:594 start_codon:yes stop_codon:yes gene_type:complete
MLQVKTFCGGYDHNFSYLLYDEESKEAVIIDTAVDPELLFKFIKENKLKIKYAVIMHSHFDHTVDLNYYRKNNIDLVASEKTKEQVEIKVNDGDILKIGQHELKVLETPGHIYDAICVLAGNKLFTSDTLFIGACGRIDLEGANSKEMEESLEKLKQLPDNTIIFPGHDYGSTPSSTIGEQKKSNPYLKDKNGEEGI